MPTADELISSSTVADLVGRLSDAAPTLGWVNVRASASFAPGSSLSDRVRSVTTALLADAPADEQWWRDVIRTALAGPGFTGWMIWPVSEAVALRATGSAEPAAFDEGLALLADLTPRLTGEFALRTFLASDLDRTLAVVRTWTSHPDEHVRRLASEGTRPRLPWARRVPELTARPDAALPILEDLYRDGSEYVRRSVANHLNDVSRADADLAVQVAAGWLKRPDATTSAAVRRALRTLVKQAHPGALALLGVGPPTSLTVTGPRLGSTSVGIGAALDFEASVRNTSTDPALVVVDFVVHYRKAGGSSSPKVFKLATRTVAPGERLDLHRTLSFRQLSTRTHHPGEHSIELQVNGQVFGRTSFDVLA